MINKNKETNYNEETEEEKSETISIIDSKLLLTNEATNQSVVRKGKILKINRAHMEENQMNEEKRLKVMMLPKKRKQLYTRIMKSIKHKNKEANKLKRKREEFEIQKKRAKK